MDAIDRKLARIMARLEAERAECPACEARLERAAIMEFDGELPREEADKLARANPQSSVMPGWFASTRALLPAQPLSSRTPGRSTLNTTTNEYAPMPATGQLATDMCFELKCTAGSPVGVAFFLNNGSSLTEAIAVRLLLLFHEPTASPLSSKLKVSGGPDIHQGP